MLVCAGVAFCQSPQPVITAVVDSASYSGFVAWGELVTIFGSNLSDGGIYQAQTVPLPKQLGTTQVFARSEALELLYVSPSQINFRMSTSGWDSDAWPLKVNVGSATSAIGGFGGCGQNTALCLYRLYAPAIFTAGYDCPNGSAGIVCGLSQVQSKGQVQRAIVTDQNYSLLTNSNPARVGVPYVLWLTGLGYPGYEGDLRSKLPSVRVVLRRVPYDQDYHVAADANVLYAGATGAFPGLYQINFTLPRAIVPSCGEVRMEVWLEVWVSNNTSNVPSIPVYVSPDETPCGTTTTTTLTSSINPSPQGQLVTLTAAVSPSAATGVVMFRDATDTLGTGTLSGGKATFSTSSLSAGSHSISAVYSGDGNSSGSTSSFLVQTVNAVVKTNTTTSVTSSPNPSTVGQSVAFTTNVSPSSATGTVTFLDGTSTLGTGTLGGGKATFSTSGLSTGSHLITAKYGSDSNYNGSTSVTLSQTVNGKTDTTITLKSSPLPGGVALTATVSPSSATGTVTFLDSDGASCTTGCLLIGSAALNNGTAALTGSLPVGVHSVVALYNGNGIYNSSTSTGITLNGTSTTITSSLNPSVSGQAVTFTVTVSPSSATGTVEFNSNGLPILCSDAGSAPLNNGQAKCAANLVVGTHKITAIYSGNSNYSGSSGMLTQTVR